MKNDRIKERLEDIRLFCENVTHMAGCTPRHRLRPFDEKEESASRHFAEVLIERLFSKHIGDAGFVSQESIFLNGDGYESFPMESRIAMFTIVREFLSSVAVWMETSRRNGGFVYLCVTQHCRTISPEKGFWFEFNKEIKIPYEDLLPCVFLKFHKWYNACWEEFEGE